MASLTVIRQALKQTIENHVEMELHCYEFVEDSGQLPAVLIEPYGCDYAGAMGRGMVTWEFRLFVLETRAHTGGQSRLDELIAGAGPNSIPEILFHHHDLGLSDGTDAFAYRMERYGGKKVEWEGIDHVGAILRVKVTTDGRV